MRIALISEHASPLETVGGVDAGGQNVYVAQVARGLAARGHTVDVFTRRTSAEAPEVVCWREGVRVIHVPAGPPEFVPKEQLLAFMPAFNEWLARFATGVGYDVAHANFWMSGMAAMALKEAHGIPSVVTFHALGRVRRAHQGATDGFPDERFAIEERVLREAACVIATCPQERDDLLSLYAADPAHIQIVPCGFDPHEFWPVPREEARQRLGLDATERIVLQLGRLVPRKGIDTVVRAFAAMTAVDPTPARLLIVGGETAEPDPVATPEIGRLRALSESLGVGDRVTFTGSRPREALRDYYGAADLFVTTPWYEPFGITPLEAMACGVPVVAADVGGLKFTVADNETGSLVRPRDAAALAGKMLEILRDPARRRAYGEAGIRRVHDRFTWDRAVGGIVAVYTDALAVAGRGASEQRADLRVIEDSVGSLVRTLQLSEEVLGYQLSQVASLVSARLARGGKLLAAGNGGSAADAQHLAAELVGRYRRERAGLAAIALTADSAVVTAYANDVGFDMVFARQVEALGRAGDVLLGLSTSGRSENVVRAFEAARERGIETVALLGRDGGPLRDLSDHALVVPSDDTQRIQEVHGLLIHLLCDLIERRLAGRGPCLSRTSSNGHSPELVTG